MSPAETNGQEEADPPSRPVEPRRRRGEGGGTGKKADPRQPKRGLPPCRVCEGPGAGLHYGVNTCDPCKAFFRRTLTGTRPLKCNGGEDNLGACPLTKTTKNPCSYCRLQKCQAVGMSKSAIRLGRYTLAKKTKDTIEVKAVQCVKSDKVLHIEKFTEEVMSAHKSFLEFMYNQPGYEHIEELKRQVTEQLLEQSDGVDPLDSQSFLFLFRQGIEPDSRVRNLTDWSHYLSNCCQQFVSFLQNVPGFRALPHEDKIGLAKSSFLEIDMMNHSYMACDLVNVVFIPHEGKYKPMFCDNIFGKELAGYAMTIARKVKRLNMTPEERCLSKVLCIFATERCTFKDTQGIESIRQLCLDSLFHVIQGRSSAEKNMRFSKIIDILDIASFVAHMYENFFRVTFVYFAELDQMATAPGITKEMIFTPRDPTTTPASINVSIP